MQPLNAIDAIAPAFTRTHDLLFHPFRAGRTWKLAASSYLAYVGSMFFPFPLFLLFIPRALFAAQPAFLPVLWAAAAVTFLLYAAVFYCCVRLEFVEFEALVTRAKVIAPMWRRYAARAWPWFLLKVVGGTVICTAFAPFAARIIRTMIAISLPSAASGAPPSPALIAPMLHALFGFYAIFFAALLILKLFGTLLSDFVLPFYALEPIPLATAVQRGAQVIIRDPLHVILYLILKPILSIIGLILFEVAVLICLIPLALVAFLLTLLGAAFAHILPGAIGHLLLITAGVLVYFIAYLAFLAVIIALVGYLWNLLEAYAIYFLAGRYPLLGDFLDPTPGIPPFTPPPAPPSPEELEDDGNEPPMPLDPAIA